MAATLQRPTAETHRRVSLPRDSLSALLLALAGAGVAAVILFFEGPWSAAFSDPATKAFIALPQTQLWLCAVGVQVALMAILSVPAVRMLHELGAESERGAAMAGVALVVGLVVVFFAVGSGVVPDYPFPHHELKALTFTAIGLAVSAPAMVTIWRVEGAVVKRFDGAQPRDHEQCTVLLKRLDRTKPGDDGNPIAGFLRMRELVHRSLLVMGTLIGGAILAVGALRNAVDTYYGDNNAYPIEYVLLYGVFFSLLLTAIYLPTYNRMQMAGRWLVEQYAGLCDPDTAEWDSHYAKRTQLVQLLQLELSLTGSLQASVAILAPLTTALVTLLIPVG